MFFVTFFSAFLDPQTWINGLLLGGIYALLGVGMTMIFGIVKLTNLAHGEFVILGAYGATMLARWIGVDPILTLVVTVPLMFIIGVVLQSVLINRVMQRGSEPALLVTFGLSIILQNVMLLLFTADAQRANVPYNISNIKIGGYTISVLTLILFVVCLVTIGALTLFLRKTYLGRAIRATSDDTAAASLMGVSVKKTYAIALGIAMATAAVAGLAVGMQWTYYPSSGGNYLLIAFGVVVIGGMGSIPGTLVAGLVFGLAQVIGGANFGQLISYILLIIMLAVRPQGFNDRTAKAIPCHISQSDLAVILAVLGCKVQDHKSDQRCQEITPAAFRRGVHYLLHGIKITGQDILDRFDQGFCKCPQEHRYIEDDVINHEYPAGSTQMPPQPFLHGFPFFPGHFHHITPFWQQSQPLHTGCHRWLRT